MVSIKKAVITTAGFGTRFLPISKTIQKEMLPILNRPLVDYVVDDLVKAGVSEIIFVISEHNKQIQHYYQENPRLFDFLKEIGKPERYEAVKNIHTKAKFTFVKQPAKGEYGTAVPVKICQDLLENEEAFFVFMGDDLIYHHQNGSEAAVMLELFNQTGASGVATFIEKPDEQLHRYGIAEIENRNGQDYLKRIVEKPDIDQAPSNLANISKYILTPDVFEYLKTQQPDPESGEFYITDTVGKLATEQSVAIHRPKGEYLDGGSVEGWLKANLTVAMDDQELRKVIAEFAN